MKTIARHPNPRKQGDAGLGMAVGWFASEGYTVCVPLTDSQDYDLIVDKEGFGPQRVQVRTTTVAARPGSYEVNLRVNGGNRSGSGKTKWFDPTKVDLLFAVCGDGSMYLVPSEKISAKSVICVGGAKYKESKVQ